MRKILLTAVALCALGVMPAKADEGAFLGTLVGAGVGGYAGSQFGHGAGNITATSTGVVVGGLAGNEIGASIDRASYVHSGYGRSPPDFFSDPVPPSLSQSRYVPNYVAPDDDLPPIASISYNYCRTYSTPVRIGNQIQQAYGVACLQPDGRWRIVQ